LFQSLSTAENDANSSIESSLCLGSDELVVFLKNDATFGVAEKSPGNVAVLKLIDRNLTSEGTVGLVEDILGCDLQTWLEVLTGEEKVKCGRSNDDLCY
jgi:hypothetical protein